MTTTTATRPWTPSDRDRLIFRWVKFDGHKQAWVAGQLDMHQSTVSRIVERYERWVAHGGPAQDGGLSRDERLRAQRWMTYERNEWIIASSLRIAGEMEEHYESSKSTIHRDAAHPSREIETATTTAVVDRSGVACRYLRLAYRVNMDQLKLVEQDDLPALEPLLLDEREYAQALDDVKPRYVTVLEPEPPTDDEPAAHTPAYESAAAEPAYQAPPAMPVVHNPPPTESPLSPVPVIASVTISPHKKPVAHAYASPQNPPEPTEPLDSVLAATLHEPPPSIRALPPRAPISAP
jgi:hypothetical protein